MELGLGLLSLGVLIVAGILGLSQIVEAVFQIPPVAAHIGTFTSPIQLPGWLNTLLGLAAATASMERATRLRWNSLLDGSD